MIDLTPLDVRKKRGDFRRILRGYDPEEVDTFLDLVADRFEELVRQNLHLSEKAESLESQLESLTGREKAVQEALVSAQKLREDLRTHSEEAAETLKDQAEREAELLKAEAKTEIGRRLGEAEGLIRERQRALEELERSRLKFLKSFRGLLEREIDAVEVEESRRPLEDTPLELEFRGAMLFGDGAGEGSDEDQDIEADPAPDGFDTQVLEDSAPVVPVGIEDLAPAVDEVALTEAGSEPADPEPADPEPADSEPADPEPADPEPADSDPGESIQEDGAPDEEEGGEAEEPKWLFSLLKKEEEKEAEG